MNNETKHFENEPHRVEGVPPSDRGLEARDTMRDEPDFTISAKFTEDIGELFTPPEKVPPEIDRAVAQAARKHLLHQQFKYRWIRWAGPIAAAAAVIIITSIILTAYSPSPQTTLKTSVAVADIDKNGRVDILDAFKLARHIESGRDIEKPWDVNGDGLINREDVDMVALAAVSLNKGVL